MSVSTIELADGRRLSAQCDTYEPLCNFPYQRELVSKKFLGLVGAKLGEARAKALQQAILGVEQLPSVALLLEHARRGA